MSDKARNELLTKGLRGIQLETAMTWADRACEAGKLADEQPDDPRWLHMFYEMEHEAIEHAAGVGDTKFLEGIRAMLAKARPRSAAPE